MHNSLSTESNRRLRARLRMLTGAACVLFVAFLVPALTLSEDSVALRDVSGVIAIGSSAIAAAAFTAALFTKWIGRRQRRKQQSATRTRATRRAPERAPG